MKKYYLSVGIVFAAAFLMTLPYLLRPGNSPSLPDISGDEKQVPFQPKTETQSETLPVTQTKNQAVTQPLIQPKSKTEEAKVSAVKIDINGFKFVPAKITVKKGTIVEWTNRDLIVHTVTADTADTAGPNSEFLNQGKTYSHAFNEIGVFNYHCKPHPFMKGAIEVIN